jgi:hypothetical protein
MVLALTLPRVQDWVKTIRMPRVHASMVVELVTCSVPASVSPGERFPVEFTVENTQTLPVTAIFGVYINGTRQILTDEITLASRERESLSETLILENGGYDISIMLEQAEVDDDNPLVPSSGCSLC